MAAADLDGKVQQKTDGTLDSSHCGWCILVGSYAMLLHSMLSASSTCMVLVASLELPACMCLVLSLAQMTTSTKNQGPAVWTQPGVCARPSTYDAPVSSELHWGPGTLQHRCALSATLPVTAQGPQTLQTTLAQHTVCCSA